MNHDNIIANNLLPPSSCAGGGDPLSDEEERYEPIPLGFGIPPPPPSYKAAISKKNEAIFRVNCNAYNELYVLIYVLINNIQCTYTVHVQSCIFYI